MNKIEKTLNGGVCKTMNILCATDDKYAPYCGVMLTSFLENHKAFHTEVYHREEPSERGEETEKIGGTI